MDKSNLKCEKIENEIKLNTDNNNSNKIDNIENNKKSIKKDKKFLITLTIFIIIFMGLIFSTIFALININNNKIISGIKIENIDVSGLTFEEAKEKLELVYNEKKEKEIILKYNEYETSINSQLLEVNYNIDEAVREAMAIGKEKNIFANNYDILFALMGLKNIEVNSTINEEIAKQTVEGIGKKLPGIVIDPEYVIEEDNLIITKGKEGIEINIEKLLTEIKNKLENIYDNENYIEIPTINKKAEEINIDKIHEEIYKEVKDAYYTKEPFKIYPEVIGIDFDIEEAKKILQEDKEEYTIKLKITKPKVTTTDIGLEAFPEELSTFSTRYDATNTDRTTNLQLACKKLNGKVVLPGETFSYNNTLGERTAATGYKNAKVYMNGEVIDGIGGGICQISSTLYNAVLRANLEIVERKNHQFVTSYVAPGMDATVAYGSIDFKFKNTRKNAIKIKAEVSNGIATISIYGIKEENEYNVTFNTKTISTIPYTVKYVNDNTLKAGTEKVKQNGANGLITETYIIKSLNGKIVSKELLSKDTYSAMQKIILRGTKEVKSTGTANYNETNDKNDEINQ